MKEEDIKKLVGKRVKAYRKSLRLSQATLGKMIDLNPRQLVLIENGVSIPRLSTLVKLSKIFNCKIEDFYKEESFKDRDLAKSEILNILEQCTLSQLTDIYSISKIVKNNMMEH